MKLFKPLYERALKWSKHPRAEPLLGGLSFVEAIIFPVMPEVKTECRSQTIGGLRARFATVSLARSVLGALVGYALGHYAFELARPLLESLGWLERIDRQVAALSENSVPCVDNPPGNGRTGVEDRFTHIPPST